MTGSGAFPKVDGDTLYAYDVNILYVLPGSTLTCNAVGVPSGTSSVILASNSGRKSALIYNNGAANAWIGASGINNLNGYKLVATDTYVYKDTEALYGTSLTAGSVNIRYMEVTGA